MATGALPTGFTEDTQLWPVMLDLLNCYEQELTDRGLHNLCMVTLAPGAEVDTLRAEEGIAWVGISSAYPSTTFPTQDGGTTSCSTNTVGVLELGLLRCIKVKERTSLTPAEAAEYMKVQMADYAAMRAAVRCCATAAGLMVLGSYRPIGPEGGVYGGAVSVSVQKR